MSEEFSPSAETVVASLIEVFKHQGDTNPIRVLESSTAAIEPTDYDNWNGGTDVYTLFLNIPLSLFAVMEYDREDIERRIEQKLSSMIRSSENSILRHVSISPILKAVDRRKSLPTPLAEDVDRIWDSGCFRLFLSHVSAHKAEVSQLKNELIAYRVSGFVAHDDIEPTKEWVTEIEFALNSAHALAALVTPDFHQSDWTDQEVGIALGKGLLVVPIRMGWDPYGFMGKSQGLRGSLQEVSRLASDLVAILLKNPITMEMMHEMLTVAFEHAQSYASAKATSHALVATNGFTLEQIDRIRAAREKNSQVKNAFNVPERIATYLSKIRAK